MDSLTAMALIAFWEIFGRRAFESGPADPVRTFNVPKTFQTATQAPRVLIFVYPT